MRTSLEKTMIPDKAVVLLDCPPSLGVLAVNCLTTAGGMIAVMSRGALIPATDGRVDTSQ